MMIERSEAGDVSALDAANIEVVAESLKLELHKDGIFPTCVSSKFMRLSARGLGTIFGRVLIGIAEAVPASELVDTTTCGGAFIGAALHALSTEMPPEKMLPFASQVAGIKCRAIGARAGLPWRSDQRLAKGVFGLAPQVATPHSWLAKTAALDLFAEHLAQSAAEKLKNDN